MELPPEIPWENRCTGCFLLIQNCICKQIPLVFTRYKIWIIRHIGEQRKSSNTARLAMRALTQCQLLTYGDRNFPLNQELIPASSYLLFPEALDHSGNPDPNGPPVHDLTKDLPLPEFTNLVVLDGTWAQARRMSHRLTTVARLPRISFNQVPSRPRLRRPPNSNTSSTLEAIAYALHYLEGETVSRPLLELFDGFVKAYSYQCSKPYTNCFQL